MAHNSRVRPFGTWTLASALLPAEVQLLDTYCFESINGDQGGSYSPAETIVIGGMGVEISGAFVVSGTAEFSNSWLFTGDGAFDGSAITIDSGAFFDFVDGSIELGSGCFINVNNGAAINIESGGDINVNSGGDVNVASGGEIKIQNSGLLSVESGGQGVVLSGGALTVSSGAALTAAGTFAMSGTETMSGTLTQTGTHIKSGTGGRTRWRVTTLASNASHAIDVDFDTYYYTQSTAVNRTLTASVTTAPVPVAGERIRLHLYNASPANTLTVSDEGIGSLFALTNASVRAELEFDGTSWRVIGFARDPALGGTVTWTGNP